MSDKYTGGTVLGPIPNHEWPSDEFREELDVRRHDADGTVFDPEWEAAHAHIRRRMLEREWEQNRKNNEWWTKLHG